MGDSQPAPEPEAQLEVDHGIVTGLLEAERSAPEPSKRVRFQLERVLSDLNALRDIAQQPVTLEGQQRTLLAYQPLSFPLSLRYRTTPDVVRYASAVGAPLHEAELIVVQPVGMRLDEPNWVTAVERDSAAIANGCQSHFGKPTTLVRIALHRSPQSIREAADSFFAELAAPEFATWCSAIREAATPDAEVALFGHSYGGTIVAQSLPWLDTVRRKYTSSVQGPLVDRVVFAGTPGLGRGFELRDGRHVHSEHGPIIHRGHITTIADLGAAAEGIEFVAIRDDRDIVACFDRVPGRSPYAMDGIVSNVNIGHDTRLRDVGLTVHSSAAAALQAVRRLQEWTYELGKTVTAAHSDYARPGTAAYLATCAALTGQDPSRFHTAPLPGLFRGTRELLGRSSEVYGGLVNRLDNRHNRYARPRSQPTRGVQ